MSDNDWLQQNLCLWAFTTAYKTCVHAFFGLLLWDPAVQYDWWLLLHRVLGLHHAALLLLSLCQLVLFSWRWVIPSLLEKSPISPHIPYQAEECRPQASRTGLSSPKACVAQRIDFFPSHFIFFYVLWLYVKLWAWQKKIKLVLFIAQASTVFCFVALTHIGEVERYLTSTVLSRQLFSVMTVCRLMSWWHVYILTSIYLFKGKTLTGQFWDFGLLGFFASHA